MRTFLLTCLLIIFPVAMFAQVQITGKVIGVDKEPIIGATVLEKGTTNGTITNIDGDFSLKVKPNATLLVSYIGYDTQELSIGNEKKFTITLKESSKQLEEVVVVGYGVQKKSSMTASVASVSAKQIQKQVTSNVASALQGQTAGVEILQNNSVPGADVNVLVRGAGSFGSTEPLYIIDGAVSNNKLNSLNMNDIESIEILKDGSAAAIYGSRAANGVVLVTTKKGKSGKPVVDFDMTYTTQAISRKLDFLNASQWRSFANTVANNSPAYEPAPQNLNPTNPSLSTDWQNLYYRSAPQLNTSVAISGGGENSTFNISAGYIKQQGVIIKSDFEKYTNRINGTYKKGRFTITENLGVAHSRKQSPPTNREIEIPTIPVKDELGRYISTPASAGYSLLRNNIVNPLAKLYAEDSYSRKTDMTGSLSIGVDLIKGLKYKLNLSGSYLNIHGYDHLPQYSSAWDDKGSPDPEFAQLYTSLNESRGESFNYTIDNLLTYNREIKKHTFDVLLGTSWMKEYARNMSINSGTNDLGSPSITTYNGDGKIASHEEESALLSFFGRVNYDYDNRYLMSVSLRSDASSKFGSKYRVGYFPSISVGWNVHQEKFFHIPWMSKLKIRGSYGELGANFIPPYSFLSLAYGPVPTIFGGKRTFGYVTRFAQQDLTWETAVSSNIGLEMGFFNNKFTVSAEYYWRKNKNLLAPLEPLPSSGQTIIINKGEVPQYNTASVENKGFELTLGYRNDWNDWHFDTQYNMSFIKNKVLALGEGVQPIRGQLMSSQFNDRPTITKEGLPIGTFWGYKVQGIGEDGDFLFENSEGKGVKASEIKEADKRVIGNPTPTFTFGWNFNISYKEWDLSLFFNGSVGNDIFAAAKYTYYFDYRNNMLKDVMNSWTPNNKSTSLPIAKTDNFAGGNSLPSDFYVEDGSYLRCKNIQIGYNFSEKFLQKLKFVTKARLFVGAQNLFTLTKYSLYDPEVGSNALFNRGVDGLQTSPSINTRSFNFGFNLSF